MWSEKVNHEHKMAINAFMTMDGQQMTIKKLQQGQDNGNQLQTNGKNTAFVTIKGLYLKTECSSQYMGNER